MAPLTNCSEVLRLAAPFLFLSIILLILPKMIFALRSAQASCTSRADTIIQVYTFVHFFVHYVSTVSYHACAMSDLKLCYHIKSFSDNKLNQTKSIISFLV